MLVKCPACGSRNSLDALIDDEAASNAVKIALSLSPVGKLLIKYLALFRPANKTLAMSRVAVLLGELLPLIEAQLITRNGVQYGTSMEIWEAALNKVLEARESGKLTPPLKTHGYLLEVLVNENVRAIKESIAKNNAKKQADKHTAEQRLEEAKQKQYERDNPPPPKERAPMPENIKAALGDILNKERAYIATLTPEQKELRKQELLAQAKELQG